MLSSVYSIPIYVVGDSGFICGTYMYIHPIYITLNDMAIVHEIEAAVDCVLLQLFTNIAVADPRGGRRPGPPSPKVRAYILRCWTPNKLQPSIKSGVHPSRFKVGPPLDQILDPLLYRIYTPI